MDYAGELDTTQDIRCGQCGGDLLPLPVLQVTCYFVCVECDLEYHPKLPWLLLSMHTVPCGRGSDAP